MDTPIQDLLFYEKYYLVMFGMFTIVYYKYNSFFGYLRNRSTSPNTNICVQNPNLFSALRRQPILGLDRNRSWRSRYGLSVVFPGKAPVVSRTRADMDCSRQSRAPDRTLWPRYSLHRLHIAGCCQLDVSASECLNSW